MEDEGGGEAVAGGDQHCDSTGGQSGQTNFKLTAGTLGSLATGNSSL